MATSQTTITHNLPKTNARFQLPPLCRVALGQIAASVAWGYFRGASWGLAGVGLALAMMFAVTAKRMSTLRERQQRRERGGHSSEGWRQPWQRPVDASAPGSRRSNTRPKGWIPFK